MANMSLVFSSAVLLMLPLVPSPFEVSESSRAPRTVQFAPIPQPVAQPPIYFDAPLRRSSAPVRR